MTKTRWWLIALAVVVLIPVIGLSIAAATFDPNRYKPQIIEAVRRATGRDLALNGPLSLKLSFAPTIEADDVALANVAGGSRPQMVMLGRAEAQLALWPLLRRRLEISHLLLVRPDILLETTADGQPNWLFGPKVPSQSLPPSPQPANASRQPPPEIVLHDLRIEDGSIIYRDGRSGRSTALTVPSFQATTDSAGSPMTVALQAALGATPFTLAGEVGPLSRLRDPQATAPWPLHLTLSAAGARATVTGTTTQPLQGRGYDARIDGAVPDLAALSAIAGRPLPPLRDMTFSLKAAEAGGRPVLSDITLHVGASDLGFVRPGWVLKQADVTAQRADQPVTIAAEAGVGTTMVTLAGTAGPLQAGNPAAPIPVDLTAKSGAATLALRGTVAGTTPATMTVDLATVAAVPDLSALGPLAGRPLPALRDIAAQAQVTGRNGALDQGISLRGLKLTLPQGDLAGDLSVGTKPRPVVDAVLTSSRIDTDSIQSAITATPKSPAQPPPTNAEALPLPQPPPLPRPSARPTAMIPDMPLPFAVLLAGDADVQVTLRTLVNGGATYQDIAGHLVLKDGKFRLDPFTARLPAGMLDLTLAADASQPTPPVALTLHAPALAVAPVFAVLRLPGGLTGSMMINADLKGAGLTPHAIAAGLDGSLSLAMVDGRIENRTITALIGPALSRAGLPLPPLPGAQSEIRCLAAKFDAQKGETVIRTFLLDTSLLHVQANGSFNLGRETLAMHMSPLARLGGTGIAVPLRVGGTFRDPQAAVDATGAAGEAARLAEGAAARNPQFGIIIGALGGDRMIPGGPRDTCAESLAVARGGQPGPVPAPLPPAAASEEKPKAPKPADILRQFLR